MIPSDVYRFAKALLVVRLTEMDISLREETQFGLERRYPSLQTI